MNSSYAGPLDSYNSLQDEHLAEYFSNPGRIRHLRRMGLVTTDGRIVSEGTVRRNVARKEHKSRTKDLLADAIVNNALEIERKRRAELKKKLEFLAKIELVEKVKSEKSHPAGIQEFNPYLHRPISAPPPRLSTKLNSHSDKLRLTPNQTYEMRRLVGEITKSRGIQHTKKSPYFSDLFSRSSTPMQLAPRPPSAPRPNTAKQAGQRRLQLTHQNGRPRTAPVCGHRTHTVYPRRSQPARSDVQITLCYTGKGLHLESSMDSGSSEVLILQQHCGGNTVQLYKGRVRPREHFTFGSKRHLDMPFGMTIYLDGLIDLRISACCEYRHQCGKLLGSKSSHFRLIKVKSGMPCYRCKAEREKLDKRERRQKILDDAVNSSPSAKEEERLDELLKRNGITDSAENDFSSDSLIEANTLHAQSEILQVHQESPYHLHSATYSTHIVNSSSGLEGPEVQDIEVQATEEYEEDKGRQSCSHSEYSEVDEEEIARTDSQSSIDTQQPSSNEGTPLKVSHQSKSSTHSRSSVSQLSSRSSTPCVVNESPNHPTLASEHSLSKVEHDLSEVGNSLNNSVEREDYDYDDDAFEELDEGDPGLLHGADIHVTESISEGFSNMGSQTGDASPQDVEGEDKVLVTQDPSHAESDTNIPGEYLNVSEQVTNSTYSLIPSENNPTVTVDGAQDNQLEPEVQPVRIEARSVEIAASIPILDHRNEELDIEELTSPDVKEDSDPTAPSISDPTLPDLKEDSDPTIPGDSDRIAPNPMEDSNVTLTASKPSESEIEIGNSLTEITSKDDSEPKENLKQSCLSVLNSTSQVVDLPNPSNSESDQPTVIVSQITPPKSSNTQLTSPPELDQITQDLGSPSASVSVHTLSPSLTLEDATMVLQRTPSATSLGSILNDQTSESASSVILSEADDHDLDIPNLEKKISALSDKHPILTTSPTHSEHETTLTGENTQDEQTSKIEDLAEEGSVEHGHDPGQEEDVRSISTDLDVGDGQCEEDNISGVLSSTVLSENNDSTYSPTHSDKLEINITQLVNKDVEKSSSLTSVSEDTISEDTESTPSLSPPGV